MTSVPRIVDIRRLKMADLDTHPDSIKECLGDWMIESDRDCVESDCVLGELEYNGAAYSFIHGYPGDNPSGVIWNETEQFLVGECEKQLTADPVVTWYYALLATNGLEDLLCNILHTGEAKSQCNDTYENDRSEEDEM